MSLAPTVAAAKTATTGGASTISKFDEDTEAAMRASLVAYTPRDDDTEEAMIARAIEMSKQDDVSSEYVSLASQLATITAKPLDKCVRALKKNGGDFNAALNWLLDPANFGK